MSRDREYYRTKLKEAVEGVLSGKLEHNQSEWHCGAAHCVCGWYEILTLENDWRFEPETSLFIKGERESHFTPRFNLSDQSLRIGWVSDETGYSFADLDKLFYSENELEDIEIIWEGMNES